MNLMLRNMRKNQEVLLELKSMSPDGKLPKGALLEAKPTIEFASKQYEIIKGLDAANEKRPKRKNWSLSKDLLTEKSKAKCGDCLDEEDEVLYGYDDADTFSFLTKNERSSRELRQGRIYEQLQTDRIVIKVNQSGWTETHTILLVELPRDPSNHSHAKINDIKMPIDLLQY